MFNLYEMCAKIEERSKIKNRLKQEVDDLKNTIKPNNNA